MPWALAFPQGGTKQGCLLIGGLRFAFLPPPRFPLPLCPSRFVLNWQAVPIRASTTYFFLLIRCIETGFHPAFVASFCERRVVWSGVVFPRLLDACICSWPAPLLFFFFEFSLPRRCRSVCHSFPLTLLPPVLFLLCDGFLSVGISL